MAQWGKTIPNVFTILQNLLVKLKSSQLKSLDLPIPKWIVLVLKKHEKNIRLIFAGKIKVKKQQ